MNFRKNIQETELGFQLAPMIDVVFLLLIYFMSASIFGQLEKEISIAIPTAESGEESARRQGEIILNLDASGTLFVNRRELTREGLFQLLSRLAELFPGQSVIVRADKETPYLHVIATLDQCHKAGIWNISFATLPEESEAPASASIQVDAE